MVGAGSHQGRELYHDQSLNNHNSNWIGQVCSLGAPGQLRTTMKHNLEFKDFESSEKSRKQIEDLIKRLDKKTRIFSPEEIFLRLKVEHNQAHKLYAVVLTLDLPGKILAAREQKRQLEPAIQNVFTEIERQLAEYKAKLRGEHIWKRLTRLQEFRQWKSKGHPLDTESFFALINPHLTELDDFVSHELSYAEATGDMAPGELTTEDIVDRFLFWCGNLGVRNEVFHSTRGPTARTQGHV